MSWANSEFSTESAYDSYLTTPSGHGGVTFVACSGDSGAPVSYPAISSNVLSVGGTTLNLNGQGYVSESGWSGSGGGISAYESQPSYQNGVVTQSTTYRTNPDVAYDANPNTGFAVYDSYNNPVSSPWSEWGGTSGAAPQWAALVAIADQGRILAGKGALDGATQTLPMLYALPSSDFHDITSGTSTGSPNYSAGTGYDLVTGLGSPIANLVVNDLVGPVSTPPTVTINQAADQADPSNASPIDFTVVFSEAVSDFAAGDVTLSGTAGATTAVVTNPSGDLMTYNVAVSGMTGSGTVIASVAAGVAHDAAGNANVASTSIDNSVTYDVTPPTIVTVSGVVVAEANPQDGILESNEQLVLSWAVNGADSIGSSSLMIDGTAVSTLYGPYSGSGGAYYLSGVFGPLAAGSHTYSIQSADSNGNVGTASGTFNVVAGSA